MPTLHCVKRVQIRSFFWSVFSMNRGKYGSEKTPYLDTFHPVHFHHLQSADGDILNQSNYETMELLL